MTAHDRMKPVPERLIQARRRAGFSTGTAAQALHLTRAGISQYETGKSTPAWPILKMIALTYGTSVEWLCGYTDDSTPDQVLVDVDNQRTARLLTYYQKMSNTDRDLMSSLADRLMAEPQGRSRRKSQQNLFDQDEEAREEELEEEQQD